MSTQYIHDMIVEGVALMHRAGSQKAREQFQHAFAEAKRTHDVVGEANVLWQLGLLETEFGGDFKIGRKLFNESIKVFDKVEVKEGKAYVMLSLSDVALLEKNFEEAEQWVMAAADIFEKCEEPIGKARVLVSLARIAYQKKDYAAAEQYWRESLSQLEAVGDLVTLNQVRLSLGELRSEAYRDTEQGKMLINHAIKWFEENGYSLVAQAARKKFAKILEEE